MRVSDDGKTVAAMDVLVPGVGEIIGGSQREERLDVLQAPHGGGRAERSRLLVVHRSATIRHGASRRIWFGIGASRPVRNWHGQHS